jgi:ABC-type transporter Mla subunit MlaD
MLQPASTVSGVPRLPGLTDVMGLLRAQTEALMELPATVASLQRAVRALADTVSAGAETLLVVQKLAVRIDGLVDELEEPVRALVPGLNRTAVLLDDPVMETIPDTIRRLQDEAMPLLRAISDTQARFAALPGASLFGTLTGRRPEVRPPAPVPPRSDPDQD